MKENLKEKVHIFIKREMENAWHENELYKRETLEMFFAFLDKTKGAGWEIKEITEQDGKDYVRYQLKSKRNLSCVFGSIRVIKSFMEFTSLMNWIDKNPWEDFREG